MEMSVKVIADSVSDSDVRLVTLEAVYPRVILAEVNTHRVLTRNGASSRAIPFLRLVQAMRENHFAPETWLYNDRGMASDAVMSSVDSDECDDIWCEAMEDAIKHATRLHEKRASKQYLNRLLEPFLMTRTLISSTRWSNLFKLRDDKAAQPEFRDLAMMMKEAIDRSSSELKVAGDVASWHLPYLETEDYIEAVRHERSFPIPARWPALGLAIRDHHANAIGMSVARCCRVSGKTFDGDHPDFATDVRTFDKLNSNPLHASPMEHIAYPLPDRTPDFGVCGNFGFGWAQVRKLMPNEAFDEVVNAPR